MRIVVVEADGFGDACADALLAAVAEAGPRVGFAAGATPTAMFETLRGRADSGALATSRIRRIEPWAIDEYVSERPNPCDNRTFFRRFWEGLPGAAPVRQFNGTSNDPLAQVHQLSSALTAAGGLDVAVLGIGRNGHLGFNEPGADPFGGPSLVRLAEPTRQRAAECWGPNPPSQGLTLGLGDILAAHRVLLLASGPDKAHIVAMALAGPVGPHCPASYLQEHSDVIIILDSAAAADLPARLR